MIHVAYRLWGGDGFFAKMTGTSMLSMFENTKSEVTIHIMHNDRLTPENRGKLCYIAGQYNQHIEFYNVEVLAGKELRKFEEAMPSAIATGVNASFYPLVIHKVLPHLDKVIFLGADTVFNIDINELWKIDLGDKVFGAVPEILSGATEDRFGLCIDKYVKYESYFNVDVMLLNPSFFRENQENLIQGCKFINEHNDRYVYFEQDVLNYLYTDKYLKLPGKFNDEIYFERLYHQPYKIKRALYHYAGAKPDLNTNDIFNKLYFDYFLKTPWATSKMFGNMFKIVNRVYNDQRNSLLYLTNLVAGKQRFFVTEKQNFEAVRKIFVLKDNEEIIEVSQPDSFANIANLMSKEIPIKGSGNKVFFLLTGQYPFLRNLLINQQFIEGRDFINAITLLPEPYGPKIDTNFIVKEM